MAFFFGEDSGESKVGELAPVIEDAEFGESFSIFLNLLLLIFFEDC